MCTKACLKSPSMDQNLPLYCPLACIAVSITMGLSFYPSSNLSVQICNFCTVLRKSFFFSHRTSGEFGIGINYRFVMSDLCCTYLCPKTFLLWEYEDSLDVPPPKFQDRTSMERSWRGQTTELDHPTNYYSI